MTCFIDDVVTAVYRLRRRDENIRVELGEITDIVSKYSAGTSFLSGSDKAAYLCVISELPVKHIGDHAALFVTVDDKQQPAAAIQFISDSIQKDLILREISKSCETQLLRRLSGDPD